MRAHLVVIGLAACFPACEAADSGRSGPDATDGTVGADCAALQAFSATGAGHWPISGARARSCDLRGAVLLVVILRDADLRGANLSGAILTDADLARADLTGADLTGARLNGVSLNGADLTGADLTAAAVQQVDFNGADLTNAVLSAVDLSVASDLNDVVWLGATCANGYLVDGASITTCEVGHGCGSLQDAIAGGGNLQGDGQFCDLTGAYLGLFHNAPANLRGADLRRTYLNGADLTAADLTGADLTGADLRNANLQDAPEVAQADLSGANLRDANLTGAVLTNVIWDGATCPDGVVAPTTCEGHLRFSAGADCVAVKSGGAWKTPAQVVFCDLSNGDLHGADLRRANMHGVDLTRADLSGADLAYANLSGADLTEAHLDGADLTGALWNGATCPDGAVAGYLTTGGLTCEGHLAFSLVGADCAALKSGSGWSNVAPQAQHCDLTGADLQSASLRGANLFSADLTGADLRSAQLQTDAGGHPTNLIGAKLTDARLDHIDLSSANLTNADLMRADLTHASLNYTVMRNVDLTGAVLADLDPLFWRRAIWVGATCPDGVLVDGISITSCEMHLAF